MAAVCRRFGVSRKTGYKWLDRYAQQGVAGLADQSKAPKRQAQAFPAEIEREILALRARYPTWGEDKLKRIFPPAEGSFDGLTAWLAWL